ncbi:hypothetical protein RUM44_000068 [Polyplax serrata]|uniref:Complex I assembly factor TIMMDC1, mitochondrial n=1 Tax=Polyplax serrata TaxID=468196 RepID=A0ABR1B4D6_POLSC
MLTKTKLPRNVGLAAILAAQKDPGNSALQEFKEKTGLYIEDDWKRVKLIFQQGADGLYHPDLYEVLDATKSGALAAGSFGAIYTYLNSIEQYRSTADSNVYQHKSDANRALARHGFQGMAYGALRYAPYGALFLGGFTLFKVCFQAYRNKYGIIEYSFGGGAIGALFRIHYGLRGMVAGGVVGSILGTIGGSVIYGVLKLTNTDIYEIKYAHYAMMQYKLNVIDNGKKMQNDVADG